MLVFFGAEPIAWQSLKQKIMALSTCEVEYVAATTMVCQVVWLRQLLGELTDEEAHPLALMVDNQSAIAPPQEPCPPRLKQAHRHQVPLPLGLHRWRADHHRVC